MAEFQTRKRINKEANYFAVFHQKKTHRFTFRPGQPIAPLRYPELEDVSLGSKCLANCPFCYTSAIKNGTTHDRPVEKVLEYYGGLELNERPFQLAFGGEGEPTMHPEFGDVMEACYGLQIMPNYTTNGMHLSQAILDTTRKYCGGVAVSCHPHLEKVWQQAVRAYLDAGIHTCLHIIVGEPGSNERFWRIAQEWPDVNYLVALPYMTAGRAQEVDVEPEWHAFFACLEERRIRNVAFGALFYSFFNKFPDIPRRIGIELYEPEVLSGYRILDDSYRTLRRSSYDLRPKFDE